MFRSHSRRFSVPLVGISQLREYENECDQAKVIFFNADELKARSNTSQKQKAAANLIEFGMLTDDLYAPDSSNHVYEMIAEISW